MYTSNAITELSSRIGYGKPFRDIGLAVSDTILVGESGRTFQFFHKLVTIDNIYLCVPKSGMSKTEFETYLTQLRKDATISALSKVLDSHPEYDDNKDYSDLISTKTALFEECVGYLNAISVLEMMLSTDRSNLSTINAGLSYEQLKLDLYGYKNDQGVEVAQGIVTLAKNSVLNAQDVIFGNSVGISSDVSW